MFVAVFLLRLQKLQQAQEEERERMIEFQSVRRPSVE
jgi:hypothetical protein